MQYTTLNCDTCDWQEAAPHTPGEWLRLRQGKQAFDFCSIDCLFLHIREALEPPEGVEGMKE
ncbi:MAG TPA: hypothetical protein VNM48_11655 [Chloroflexota bacterium]|nr:hypothetical protein [Chloroflexota bacterium]